MVTGGLGEGVPEYRRPFQSLWGPHLALKSGAEARGRRGRAGWILQIDGVDVAVILALSV